ncbi:MAG: arginase [Gammaproteobacteria bacterium]|nr:arginase [Gammaproteobacteria bacterium]
MSVEPRTIHLVGYASGVAASDSGCSQGPIVMQNSSYLFELKDKGANLQWDAMIKPNTSPLSPLNAVIQESKELAAAVSTIVKNKQFFTVIGGDHSSAIGTWSGAYSQVHQRGAMGLIWIDAHMDSHTPETSETGNIHGMPLACLLGYGHAALTSILTDEPKLKPEHVCLIGIRSYEAGEEALLKKLNVRVFYMEEVNRRGLKEVMKEALEIVNKGTVCYGITIDLDSIDPVDAPGTGVAEPDGLSANELCAVLPLIANDSRLIGAEIVEFDPHFDHDKKTEKLVSDLLAAMTFR